ncbi:MAG: Uma2 family endonuclease [Caulobacter sp.]|nr:Uma2 family endonuclease [Caulobacter sp.]
MNAPVRPPPDLSRRLFTTQDVFRMVEAGIMDEDENVELIHGELVVMAAKKNDHEIAKSALIRWLARNASDDLVLGVETTLYLAEMLFVEPDLMLYPGRLKPQEITGRDITLLIEVSDDSLSRDLGLKAGIYAQYGVVDYWVVDAERRRIVVHRRPADEGYRSVEVFEADAEVTALRAPALRMRLRDLVGDEDAPA